MFYEFKELCYFRDILIKFTIYELRVIVLTSHVYCTSYDSAFTYESRFTIYCTS